MSRATMAPPDRALPFSRDVNGSCPSRAAATASAAAEPAAGAGNRTDVGRVLGVARSPFWR